MKAAGRRIWHAIDGTYVEVMIVAPRKQIKLLLGLQLVAVLRSVSPPSSYSTMLYRYSSTMQYSSYEVSCSQPPGTEAYCKADCLLTCCSYWYRYLYLTFIINSAPHPHLAFILHNHILGRKGSQPVAVGLFHSHSGERREKKK